MIADQEIERLNGYVGENLTLELQSDVLADENNASEKILEPEKLTLDEISINDGLCITYRMTVKIY